MLMIYPQSGSVDLSEELGPELGMGDTDLPPLVWPRSAGPPGVPRTGLSLTAGEQGWERLPL